jgi:hypothetical protein
MKTLRALALVMVLAGSAYAGDIQYPIAPPPPPSAACAGDNSVTGNIPNGATISATVMTIILETLLSLR